MCARGLIQRFVNHVFQAAAFGGEGIADDRLQRCIAWTHDLLGIQKDHQFGEDECWGAIPQKSPCACSLECRPSLTQLIKLRLGLFKGAALQAEPLTMLSAALPLLSHVLRWGLTQAIEQLGLCRGSRGRIGKKGATYAACFRDLMNVWGMSTSLGLCRLMR